METIRRYLRNEWLKVDKEEEEHEIRTFRHLKLWFILLAINQKDLLLLDVVVFFVLRLAGSSIYVCRVGNARNNAPD